MNSKFYVSLEAARLLREKGYDRECDYHIEEVVYGNMTKEQAEKLETKFPCPTKSEAIDWLESKEIGISIIFFEIDMYEYVVESKDCYYSVVESGYKGTRLEAEDAAIIKALELL
jgi:hypothetical protein